MCMYMSMYMYTHMYMYSYVCMSIYMYWCMHMCMCMCMCMFGLKLEHPWLKWLLLCPYTMLRNSLVVPPGTEGNATEGSTAAQAQMVRGANFAFDDDAYPLQAMDQMTRDNHAALRSLKPEQNRFQNSAAKELIQELDDKGEMLINFAASVEADMNRWDKGPWIMAFTMILPLSLSVVAFVLIRDRPTLIVMLAFIGAPVVTGILACCGCDNAPLIFAICPPLAHIFAIVFLQIKFPETVFRILLFTGLLSYIFAAVGRWTEEMTMGILILFHFLRAIFLLLMWAYEVLGAMVTGWLPWLAAVGAVLVLCCGGCIRFWCLRDGHIPCRTKIGKFLITPFVFLVPIGVLEGMEEAPPIAAAVVMTVVDSLVLYLILFFGAADYLTKESDIKAEARRKKDGMRLRQWQEHTCGFPGIGRNICIVSMSGRSKQFWYGLKAECKSLGIGFACMWESQWGDAWWPHWKANVFEFGVRCEATLIVLSDGELSKSDIQNRRETLMGSAQQLEVTYLQKKGISDKRWKFEILTNEELMLYLLAKRACVTNELERDIRAFLQNGPAQQ